jgi:hypothetical protein
LKAHQLATSPVIENLMFGSRSFAIIAIVVEIVLGIWLASCFAHRIARSIGILFFASFLVVSVFNGILGKTSCGCFGVVEIHPFVSSIIDVACVAMLVHSFRVNCISNRTPISHVGWIVAGVLLIAIALFGVFQFNPGFVDPSGVVIGEGSLVVVDTTDWVGKRFPLKRFINGSAILRNGTWRVILYHVDCPKCQELIGQITAVSPKAYNVAFVEVAPFGTHRRINSDSIVWLRLSTKHEWFVSAPEEVWLEDGVVSTSLR